MILEGLASMFVFFIILTLIVQIGILVVARGAAATALEGALRRATVTGDVSVAEERLARDLHATVPGTDDVDISLTVDADVMTGTVSFDWVPPGPNLMPLRISVTRTAPLVVPP